MALEFITTSRGVKKLVLEGFIYVHDRLCPDGRQMWRCDRRSDCKARVHTLNGRVTTHVGNHTHSAESERLNSVTQGAISVLGAESETGSAGVEVEESSNDDDSLAGDLADRDLSHVTSSFLPQADLFTGTSATPESIRKPSNKESSFKFQFPLDEDYKAMEFTLRNPKDTTQTTMMPSYMKSRILKHYVIQPAANGEERIICRKSALPLMKQSEFPAVFTDIHITADGHSSSSKTYSDIRKFYHHCPKQLVDDFVKKCVGCAYANSGAGVSPVLLPQPALPQFASSTSKNSSLSSVITLDQTPPVDATDLLESACPNPMIEPAVPTDAPIFADPPKFWNGVKALGPAVFKECIDEMVIQLQKYRTAFLTRDDLRDDISQKLSSFVKELGIAERIRKNLERKRLLTLAETDTLENEIAELERRAKEQREKQMEVKRKASILNNVHCLFSTESSNSQDSVKAKRPRMAEQANDDDDWIQLIDVKSEIGPEKLS